MSVFWIYTFYTVLISSSIHSYFRYADMDWNQLLDVCTIMFPFLRKLW